MSTSLRSSTPTAQGGAGRLVVRNTLVLTVGQIVTLVSMLLWTMIVARYIGPATYGVYSYAQATLGILAIFVNLGLDDLLTRTVAQHPEDGLQYLVTFTGIKLCLAIAVLGGFLGFVYLQGWPRDRAAIAVIVTAIWFATALIAVATSVLQAHQVMHYVVIAQSANAILTLVTGALAVWTHQPFVVVLVLSLSATVLQAVLLYYFAVANHPVPDSRLVVGLLPWREILAILRTSLSFAALALIAVLYNNVVIILLRQLTSDDRTIGYFAAAQRIYLMSLIVPEMLLQSIFPAFSSVYSNSPERFPAFFERAYRYLFFVTVPMGLGLWVVGPNILTFIYGSTFVPAGGTLRVLSLILLISVGYVMGPAMVAMNRQTLLSLIFGGALVGVAAAGYWAIPRYGAEGAAWALVIGSLISFVVYNLLLFRWLSVAYPVTWVAKTVIASVLMALTVQWLIPRVHFLIVSFLIGPVIYLVLHLILRTLSASDWNDIQHLVPEPVQRILLPILPRRLDPRYLDRTSETVY